MDDTNRLFEDMTPEQFRSRLVVWIANRGEVDNDPKFTVWMCEKFLPELVFTGRFATGRYGDMIAGDEFHDFMQPIIEHARVGDGA